MLKYIPFVFLFACQGPEEQLRKNHGGCYKVVDSDEVVYRECDDWDEEGNCLFCDEGYECYIVDSTRVTMDSPESCQLGDSLMKSGVNPSELRDMLLGWF